MFPVPSMVFLLLSRSYTQVESCLGHICQILCGCSYMSSCLGLLFCSIGLCVSLCAHAILFLLLWLCDVACGLEWASLRHCSLCSGLFVLSLVFCGSCFVILKSIVREEHVCPKVILWVTGALRDTRYDYNAFQNPLGKKITLRHTHL